MLEHWPGRKNASLDSFKSRLLAGSNAFGSVAFLLVFLKIESMATSVKRWVHSPGR